MICTVRDLLHIFMFFMLTSYSKNKPQNKVVPHFKFGSISITLYKLKALPLTYLIQMNKKNIWKNFFKYIKHIFELRQHF